MDNATMYYVMHIPTGQFLYRTETWLDRPKTSVALYTEYEIFGCFDEYTKITCRNWDELLEWFTQALLMNGETLTFSNTFQVGRRPEFLHEFTLVPIQE